MLGKEFDRWHVVIEKEYKNKTDISTCLIVLVFYSCFFGFVPKIVICFVDVIGSDSLAIPYLIRLLFTMD